MRVFWVLRDASRAEVTVKPKELNTNVNSRFFKISSLFVCAINKCFSYGKHGDIRRV